MTRGVSQEAFFARIRSALTDRGEPVDLPDDLEVARVVGADENLVDTFTRRATEAGMKVERVADASAVADKVVVSVPASYTAVTTAPG